MRTKLFFPLVFAALLALGLAAVMQPARAGHSGNVIYVNAAATGANNGSSWADAFTNLQDALAHAVSGNEIWVAAGVYYPDEGTGQTDNDRASTFQLKNGVALYGGFNGTETQRDQRDPVANITVLSGDIDKNDTVDANGVVTDTANISGSNALHVVTGSGTDNTAVLDGFTITAGQANGGGNDNYGGGMYNDFAGSPTLTNVTFSANSAGNSGGGMYNNTGSPALINVTFANNSAYNGGGMYNSDSNPVLTNVTFANNAAIIGGGMFNISSNPTLTNVTFSGNAVNNLGGGMYNFSSSPALSNVTFSGNSSNNNGGGIYNDISSNPTLTNITFSNNSATNNGGGMYNYSSSPVLSNVTFYANAAGSGGGMFNDNSNPTLTNVTFSNNSAGSSGGGMYNNSSSPTLTNVIIANSSTGGDCVNGVGGSIAPGSTNNLIEDNTNACGLTNGTNGNITGSDPQLGALTDFGGPGRRVFPLLLGSPAIDAGANANCPAADQRGATRPVDGNNDNTAVCDIGAFEFVGRWYVDGSAAGAATGLSWSTAFTTVQDALTRAGPGEEIWVAAGVYYPDEGAGQTDNDRASTFQLKNGVALYGGFNGTETQRDQRDPAANVTVLSGDIDKNDTVDANGVVTDTANINGSNALHVVTGSGTDNTAVLDGFTITAGQANGGGNDNYGGGMYNIDSNPTLTNVTFSANSAGNSGGGIYNDISTPALTNVTFSANSAGNNGGGMYNIDSSPTLTNVTFSANSAGNSGGGMYNFFSIPTLTNVTFANNSASTNGGGMYNYNSNPALTNVTFSANSASSSGGGMYNQNGSSPLLTNTIIANSTGGDCVNVDTSSLDAASGNNLIEDNTNACGLTDGTNGNIIGSDPQLGALTDYGGPGRQVFPLLSGSPAIDAGNNANCPAADQRGATRPVGAICDIGAFEFVGRWYVDGSAAGAATGLSWTDAFTTVQDALTRAGPGEEIWVAAGVYYPDEGAGQTDNDRTSTFQLKNGVALYGGFNGTETQRDQRDPAANVTVLSGDIDKNDTVDANGVVTDTANINGSNALHVVTGSGTDNTAVLDGFTITAGQANGGGGDNYGGGMYNFSGGPALTNVTFSANAAGNSGGGMYNNNSSPTLTNVTFANNAADINGGGMFNNSSSNSVLTNVTFANNLAYSGGGIYNWSSSPTLTNVTFANNAADNSGGGIYNWSSSPTLTNVTFANNAADNSGGGMYNNSSSNSVLTNVTFANNSAYTGGGMLNASSTPALTNVTFANNAASNIGGGMYNSFSNSPTLINVTFSGNSAGNTGGGMYNFSSSPVMTNTIIANSSTGGDCVNGANGSIASGSTNNLIEDNTNACGLSDGVNGNIVGSDPQLGALTDYGGPGQQVFPLLSGSPAIDAGTNVGCPATDQRAAGRPASAACDIGAYEFGARWYVDDSAAGAATGLSWTDAFTTVQDALTRAGPGDEIWVAAGVYYPDEGAGQTDNDRTSTFQLKNGVALYGGFNGTETQRDQRDPMTNITVLSGDIDKNDTVDANGVVIHTANINGNNAYHVVTGSGTDDTAVLDGFTITAGQANGTTSPNNRGGGMYNDTGSPTLTNVTFSANSASYGGGMYNSTSNPTLTNITFSANAADSGGGMYNDNSSPALTNVTFANNLAYSGGGIYNWSSSPTLTNVTFANNAADNNGGGMYNLFSSPTLTNITFSANSASYGGGMYNNTGSPTMTNVTFSANSAIHGGGMYNDTGNPTLTDVTFSGNSAIGNGGGMSNWDSSPTLTNVTFADNSAISGGGGMYNQNGSSPLLTNTIIANSTGGDCVNDANSSIATGSANNLIEDSTNACGLSDGVNGNIVGSAPRLGALTDFGGPGRQVFPLLPGSPAIDAGTNAGCPSTDQRGAARPVDGNNDNTAVCDIGAFEIGYNLTLSKQVDNPAPLPGQTITFTLVVANTDLTVTNGLISDTLPAGLNFLGPITLQPAAAGTVGAAPPTLASGLTISSGQRVTVTFPVTVSYGLAAGTQLANTASASATEVSTPASATTVVTVGNAPPTADAGPDQTANPGDTVTLDGSGSSDPNGDTLTYRWTQTGGTAVTLSDPTAAQPTFTAPNAFGVLTFTLTVTDTAGLNDSDTVVITVTQSTFQVYLPLVINKP